MKRKILILTILVCTSIAFTGCNIGLKDLMNSQTNLQKKVTLIESLLSSDYDEDEKSVACAIASQPSKVEVLREYQKIQRAKPSLSDYNTRYTPAYGRERDESDKDNEFYKKSMHWEKQYAKLTEAERNELRKKDYNNDLKIWETEPQNKTNSYFSSLENAITSLSQADGIRLVDRDKTEAILAEHQFQNASLWNSNENLAEVGKMLNAQYLIFIKPVVGSSSIESQFEFVNVSTFQKIALQPSYGHFSEKEINNVIDSAYQDEQKADHIGILDGTWLCNGIKSNGFEYTSETRAYLTPFSSGYRLVDISEPPKKFSNKDLANAKLEIDGDYAYLTKGKENKTEFELSYLPEDSHFFGPKRKWDDTGDSNYKIVEFTIFMVYTYELKQKMTDNYIGVVTLVAENPEDSISGNAYKQKNVLAINIGSEKGKEYFLVFTKIK